jgi:putative ABC transport system permease protein
MYPELMTPLLVLLGAATATVGYIAVGRPVLRRLAFRQIARRPSEAVLVVLGSLLGTALIVASLVVGDSLDRSVRQTAYDVLGPVDEVVRTTDPTASGQITERLRTLRSDPSIDGMLTVYGDVAAASAGSGGRRSASPRTLVWQLDFTEAARFGEPDRSGLDVADPGPGSVVINQTLADALRLSVGRRMTLYLYGRQVPVTVGRVVPATGLAGMGLGATVNSNVFVSGSTLTDAARAAEREPMTSVLVSNRGGVEGGDTLTTRVTAHLRGALAGLDTKGASVTAPKHEVLRAADVTAAALGSLFLFIASFSIIAGVLLVVNIFVMLAEERKGQLGILRAVGMRRRRVTAEFALEGSLYAAAAAVVGTALGVLVGRVVVVVAINVLNAFERSDNKLDIVFAVSPVSLVNGASMGFLIAFLAVVLTSVRIARTNIIAAIRDLPSSTQKRPRRGLLVASAVATAVFAAASVPVLSESAGAAVYLVPVLALVSAIPLLRRLMALKVVTTAVALLTLVWGLGAHVVRPRMFDSGTTATYVVMGTMLSFAAVVLISQYQWLVVRPFRPLVNRPSERGLAARLAVAYPTARVFRTGATLAMYCIVVLVIVLLAQISAVIRAGVDTAVRDATAGWTMRADFNPATPLPDSTRSVTSGAYAGMFQDVAPLLTATADGTDPLGRTSDPVQVTAVGVPGQLVSHAPDLEDRLPRLAGDEAAWRLVLSDPRFAIVDLYYGAHGGPQGTGVQPGDRITMTDPRTGSRARVTVAGLMSDGSAFYNIGAGENRWPLVMSTAAVRNTFGDAATVSSFLLRTTAGVDRAELQRSLQGRYLDSGLVVTDIPTDVRNTYAANTQMFRLMQGYLALGLLIAIIGLGVVMVRSVRERRRTIGVLRALGFRARTIRWSFLAESTLVVVGTALGILTTYLLYRNSPAFNGVHSGFPVAWTEILLTVGAAMVASLAATAVPARRAAAIRPAVAVRVAD